MMNSRFRILLFCWLSLFCCACDGTAESGGRAGLDARPVSSRKSNLELNEKIMLLSNVNILVSLRGEGLVGIVDRWGEPSGPIQEKICRVESMEDLIVEWSKVEKCATDTKEEKVDEIVIDPNRSCLGIQLAYVRPIGESFEIYYIENVECMVIANEAMIHILEMCGITYQRRLSPIGYRGADGSLRYRCR